MEELFEPGLILSPRLALPDEGRIGGEDHPLLHAPIVFGGDLPILELRRPEIKTQERKKKGDSRPAAEAGDQLWVISCSFAFI